ncbi:MAG: hypothetical protein ACI9QD_000262 [Thermoproteota archaeon]|jgi:hypothetical protein
MKKLLLVSLFMLISQVSFANIYEIKTDKLKNSVRQAASEVMIEDEVIKTALEERDIWNLIVSTDLLDSDKAFTITADIGPEESNCGCQDIFRVYMSAKVINGDVIIKSATSVEILDSDK